MTKIKFNTAYGDRVRVTADPVGESLTQQNFKAETDIINIIKKHDRTGIIEHVARGVAQYGDYSEINEYREALDMVSNANASFMELPAEIRAMFGNDAGAFFEFATDPKNKSKMQELGLAETPEVVPNEAFMTSSQSAETKQAGVDEAAEKAE
jgi:phage internal scaffolding protein